MRYRVVAILAMAGLFVSTYLLLYSLGYYGAIMCGTGACEVVQTSSYAVFLGLPVPGWGTGWYAGMLVLAVLSVVGVAALFVALALFLRGIDRTLEEIGGPATRFVTPANYLAKIRLGVRRPAWPFRPT